MVISLVSGAHGRPKLVSNALNSLRFWKASTRTVLPELSNPMIMMVTFLEMEKKNEPKALKSTVCSQDKQRILLFLDV